MGVQDNPLRDRYLRFGYNRVTFSTFAKISPGALANAEKGRSSDLTLKQIERAFEELQAAAPEPGATSPSPTSSLEMVDTLVEFRVEYGAKSVIVKGPINVRDEMADSVQRLMRDLRSSNDG